MANRRTEYYFYAPEEKNASNVDSPSDHEALPLESSRPEEDPPCKVVVFVSPALVLVAEPVASHVLGWRDGDHASKVGGVRKGEGVAAAGGGEVLRTITKLKKNSRVTFNFFLSCVASMSSGICLHSPE